MYLCICNAHRLEDVRAAALSTGGSAAEVYAALGGPPRCGRCLPRAQEAVDAVRSECCQGTAAPATGCCQERIPAAASVRPLALVEA